MSGLAAGTIILSLYISPTEAPFKEIRCAATPCKVDGLLPLGDSPIPVTYLVGLDKGGHVSLDMKRGTDRYRMEIIPPIGSPAQPVHLFRSRGQEGQDGLVNDLVVRKDADLGQFWVQVRIEE